jgi:Fe-S-cluster containining protein
MRLTVLHDERFSCHSCTDCCRHQYVELFTGEPERIEQLIWPDDDPLHGIKGTVHHGGKIYLAHRPDGSCVFLNGANGLCRIHEQFGVDAKPMSCRIFPFQITPTFTGHASVSARYDCPTVRKNIGEPYADALPFLQRYVDQRPLPAAGFDDVTRCHLDQEQIGAVSDFLMAMLGGFERNDQRAIFILYMADLLSLTAADELDRAALAMAFAPLKAQVLLAADATVKKPGLVHRMAFRTLLGMYLRRDEDILDKRASRVIRLGAMMAFVLGAGSFHGLGLIHPIGPLRSDGLFKSHAQPPLETFALLWRLVRNKLESFTFMGTGNGGRNMIVGLRSLAMLYPLTLAAATHSAAARHSEVIEAADTDYAVTAIEHSFGRSAVLNPKLTGSIETLLLDRKAFIRLVKTI